MAAGSGNLLAARGECLASHRDGRGAPPARRDDREYREYVSEEQRSRWGCIARRMQPDFHHGLLARGFTFVELLVVVTIVTILASAIMPLAKVTARRTR